MEELKVFINSPGEHIIRTGDAAEIDRIANQKIRGTIVAPYEWAALKLKRDDKTNNIQYSYKGMFLKLTNNETGCQGVNEITGQIVSEPSLDIFKINTGFKRTPSELAQFLKMNRILFANREESMILVSNLEKFKIKVEQELEDVKNFQGNKKYLFEQQVKHDMTLSFVLDSRIFQGSEVFKFKVEIMFDVRDKSVEMWLESVELKELQNSQIEEMINEQLDLFSESFPLIPRIEVIL